MSDGLEDVVAAETVLIQVDGPAGRLIVRGLRLEELAGRSFEAVVALLWDGFFAPACRGSGARRARCRRGSRRSTGSRPLDTGPTDCRRSRRCALLAAARGCRDDPHHGAALVAARAGVRRCDRASARRAARRSRRTPARPRGRLPADDARRARPAGAGARARHLSGDGRRPWAQRLDLRRARGRLDARGTACRRSSARCAR